MIGRRARTSKKFTHVANLVLRGVLESKPEQVKPAKMRQVVGRTLDALRRDVTNDDPALYHACPNVLRPHTRPTGHC
jgi:hypothetical protein